MTDLYEKFHREQDLFTSLDQLKKAILAEDIQEGIKIQFDNSEYDAVMRELVTLDNDEREESIS